DPAGGRQPSRGPGGAVPDDHAVGADGLQRLGGVLERFALGDRGALGGEVDDVRGEPLGGRLEGDAGAGGVLEEEVHHGATAQGRELLDLAGADGCHVLGDVQDADGVLAGQVGGGEQVPHACPTITTSLTGAPFSVSSSPSRTLTFSEAAVGRFLPTWSARIGSSRCPRSTSTASRTMRGRPRSESASRAARMVRPEKSTSSTRTTTRSS